MKKLQGLIILVLIGSSLFSLGRTFFDIYSRADRLDSLKEEVSSLEKENEEIKNKIADSDKDTFIEKEARDRLGYSFPEEKVLIVSDFSPKKEEPVVTVLGIATSPVETPPLAWKKLLLW